MTELKTPEAKALHFTANGKTYVIENRLSIARKIICDQLVLELEYGGNMGETFKDWRNVYDLCNGQKFADIAVLAHNRMEGVKKWEERHDQVLLLCALFINRDDEDRRFITQEEMQLKISDWEQEGIEYAFFLQLAKMLLSERTKSWSDTSPNTSESQPN